MRAVFVNTLYWIALINPKDQWHDRAIETKKALGGHDLSHPSRSWLKFSITFLRTVQRCDRQPPTFCVIYLMVHLLR